jgi:hypothetical protein
MDEFFWIFCLRISLDLIFHVNTCKNPNYAWTELKDLLGK